MKKQFQSRKLQEPVRAVKTKKFDVRGFQLAQELGLEAVVVNQVYEGPLGNEYHKFTPYFELNDVYNLLGRLSGKLRS